MRGNDAKIYEFYIQEPLYRHHNEYEKEYDDHTLMYMKFFIVNWSSIIDKPKSKEDNNANICENKSIEKKKVKEYKEQLISIDFF